MAENLKAIGFAAGLTPEQQKRLDDFNKSLSVHQTLVKMPADAANAKFNKLTPAQQANLVQNFGNEDPVTQPKRSPLETAFHYTFGVAGQALGYAGSHLLAGLGNVSDFMTRAYRTGAIAADQGLSLGDAWTIANDKGDKVFSPDRINGAKAKFGNDAVDIAMRIAAGEKFGAIASSATPDQIKYLQLADPTNKTVGGMSEEDTKAARANFQDTLDAVNAAKYSPGRQIANAVLPSQLEGSGLFYKAISGTVDAAYRVLADPLLVAGKAKRAWDVTHYALDVVIGEKKVAEVFAQPSVQQFWSQYGEGLTALTKAQTDKSPEAIALAKRNLATIAPEFGPAVIKEFQKAGIDGPQTAKAFFENSKQAAETLKGAIGRQRVIVPRMDPLRQARIAAVTTGRKVFNIDAVGPKLTDDYFFGGATTTDGIAEKVINGQKEIVDQVTKNTNFKGIKRFSTAYIQHRIDRVKAAATPMPIFEKEAWDVTSPDASQKVYQLARLVMPQREARLLGEAFDNIDEVGKRKDVYYGLWGTIAELRGMNTTAPGQQIVRYLTGKSQAVFGLDDAFREKGSMPSDFNNFVSAPGMKDLDRAAGRNTLFQKMMGVANSDLANKMTSAWSFLTLAGPRYAIRNAGEDLMVNLAIGNSPWGLAKQYHLNNRINTFLSAAQKVEGEVKWANNPLGAILRVTNRKDVKKYQAELTGLKTKFDKSQEQIKAIRAEIAALPKGDAAIATKKQQIADIQKDLEGGLVEQTRQIFANAVTEGRINNWRKQLGMKPLNEEDALILKEHIKYGNLENALGDVSEGGLNAFTGNDFISRAENLVKQTGVSTHALTVTPVKGLAKKPGERAFTAQALHQQDQGSMYSWMLGISRYSNDELGGIAVANLDNPSLAISKMTEWMNTTKQGQQFLKDARLANNMSAEEIARLNFGRAKAHFVKRDGSINEELLNKVRTFKSTETVKELPKGFKFKFYGTDSNLELKYYLRDEVGLTKQMANQALNANSIVLLDDSGKYVGHISWNAQDGKIQLINVSPEMQRKGYATNLFDKAIKKSKGNIPKPVHSTDKSPEGELWAKSLETKNGEWVISGKLGLEDLPTNADDIPQVIVGPTLVPAVEVEQMTSKIVQNGWTFLGLSNARMSRQPMVLNEIVNTRKSFKKSGFEEEWIKNYQRGIDPTDAVKMAAAKDKALKDLTQVTEERAISQTIAYVDNPLVRSQLAWNLKNFARFYRATEDFYRRMYRVVRYNPEALVKAALTYDGIAHSGWVKQDDQGNSYFIYPGIGPTYNAIQSVMDRLGIAGEFKIPLPVNFGANLKMITPSLNPDSLVPTFSGPVAGISFTALTELVNIWSPGAADTIKGYAMGKYAVDQPIVSAFLPAHINRLYAAMNTDERNSQYASAYRKAVTYLEASGHGIPKRYDADGNLLPPTSAELETYRQQVKSTTMSILGLRFAFGFFAPASPQVTLKSDMAQWVSDNNSANFKQAWNDLLAQYPGDYDAAMQKWVELYPNQIPFTVTESERKTLAPLRYAAEAGQFVDANSELFKQYPSAAAYLIPHKSGFSFDAYKTMKDIGLIQNKRVSDYLQEVQTAADLQTYYAKKNEFDTALTNSYADFERTQLRRDFDAWKSVFFAGHPLVADELSKGSQKAIDRLKTLDELTQMVNAKPGVAPKTEKALGEMVKLYQSYKAEKDNYDQYGGNKAYIDSIKADTLTRMKQLAEFNENTKAAYDTIFGTLLGD